MRVQKKFKEPRLLDVVSYTIVSHVHVDLALRIGSDISLALLWQCGTGVRVIN